MLALLTAALAAPLTPTFAWAPADGWNVAYTESMRRSGTGPALSVKTRARWHLAVTGSPGALTVTASAYTLDAPSGLLPNDGAGLYARALLASAASFRLGTGGVLGDLLDLPGLRAPADKALAAAAGLTDDDRRIAASTMSDARVTALVTDWWTALVGAWAGAPLVQGQPDAFATRTPVPALANAVVQTDSTRTYDGPAACTAGGATTCEAFTLRSALNPSAAGVAIGEYSRRPGALAVASLSQETTAHLVSEANDLRPRSLSIERHTHTRGAASGTPVEVDQVETRTWTFTPAAPK